MIVDSIKQTFAITSWIALVANIIDNPVWTAVFQFLIMLTCITVMGHIFLKCYIVNNISKKKREVRNGRIAKNNTP